MSGAAGCCSTCCFVRASGWAHPHAMCGCVLPAETVSPKRLTQHYGHHPFGARVDALQHPVRKRRQQGQACDQRQLREAGNTQKRGLWRHRMRALVPPCAGVSQRTHQRKQLCQAVAVEHGDCKGNDGLKVLQLTRREERETPPCERCVTPWRARGCTRQANGLDCSYWCSSHHAHRQTQTAYSNSCT